LRISDFTTEGFGDIFIENLVKQQWWGVEQQKDRAELQLLEDLLGEVNELHSHLMQLMPR